jgi:carbamoyl-phosphate synthase small subunit
MQPESHIPKAAIAFEDGTYYEGRAVGARGTTQGELCFNTGMTGYQEIFTDPSYFGQILIATNVHIGNYGTIESEVESNSVKISGLVCRNFNEHYSRPLADQSLQEYFEKENLVGIDHVDTRAIVRHVRTKGAMNAVISSEITDRDQLIEMARAVPSMKGLELASKVSTEQSYEFGPMDGDYKVAVLDLGVKRNILRCLADRGCHMRVFPSHTTFEEMEKWSPDAYFISNGPGDPAAMPYAVETVRRILDRDKPLFGICLGHQILALAMGMNTYKMHHGHRGINHPVKNLLTGHCEITSQNHGFGVHPSEFDKVKGEVEIEGK